MRVEFGPGFLSRLRAALAAAPEGTRYVIGAAEPPAFALEAREPVIAVGLPVSDTCKEVVAGLVRRTVPRETLVDLKGPWLITRESFGSALGRLGADAPVEDPLQLCRAAGLSIHVMVRT